MAKVHWKGSALLAPIPSVMVSCGTLEQANIITIGWCGVVSTRPPRVYISVRPERHSHGIIKESGEFVINLTPSSLVEVCDYVGTVTGRKVDKVKKTGLTMIPSKEVSAPSIENSPLSLECKVIDVLHHGSHDMFIADVVSVSVDEELLDETGKLRLDRSNLLVFAHGEYFTLGKKLGPIGISVANKKKGKKAKVNHPRKDKK
ncbi:MAG: flavin reductase family protein [Clostridia bacterium]|nr:flavin reductase family protein [Clostridia bacterium]MBP3377347.1 flavin reductase family protein [Clostridia bacterium]